MRKGLCTVVLFLLAAAAHGQTFVKTDTMTGPNWMGHYGASGYQIPLGTIALPSFATVAFSGDSTWTWAPGATCWYGSKFTMQVNITDGQTHQIALFVQDYDKQGRSETVNGQSVTNFTAGEYLLWTISGNATFTVSSVAGPNAVVNGLFFDPGPATNPIAHQVILNWTASTATGVSAYNIYRNGTKLVSLGVVTTYTDGTVQAGQTYSYAVTSVANGVESTQAPVTAFTIPSP